MSPSRVVFMPNTIVTIPCIEGEIYKRHDDAGRCNRALKPGRFN